MKVRVLSCSVCVWHARAHIHAKKLLCTLMLTGTKNKFSLRADLEKSSEAWQTEGRALERGEKINNKKKKIQFINFLPALHMQAASYKLGFSI